MNKKTQIKDQNRREFIKKSTLVGAGVAMTSTGATAAVEATVETAKPEQKGYQLTQHVLDYYKSADV